MARQGEVIKRQHPLFASFFHSILFEQNSQHAELILLNDLKADNAEEGDSAEAQRKWLGVGAGSR